VAHDTSAQYCCTCEKSFIVLKYGDIIVLAWRLRNGWHSQPAPSPPISQGVSLVSTSANTPLFNRPDTLFGVCEGIGREFGIHPNILRLGFAVPMIWNPVAVIGTYVGLGVAVYLSRKLVPTRAGAVEQAGQEQGHEQEMALAA